MHQKLTQSMLNPEAHSRSRFAPERNGVKVLSSKSYKNPRTTTMMMTTTTPTDVNNKNGTSNHPSLSMPPLPPLLSAATTERPRERRRTNGGVAGPPLGSWAFCQAYWRVVYVLAQRCAAVIISGLSERVFWKITYRYGRHQCGGLTIQTGHTAWQPHHLEGWGGAGVGSVVLTTSKNWSDSMYTRC